MIDKYQPAKKLLAWWDKGHASLPWRENPNPYVIWVSEIMLQQTQISTVIPYFERWMIRFPTLQKLANTSLDDVLKMWEGLGYYSRARNIHAAAKIVMESTNGRLPHTVPELMALPGIGRYTAGAIASIAFNQAAPVLDGNVIRILSRLQDLEEDVTRGPTKRKLWQLAGSLVPDQRPGDYNQALMELGQKICLKAQPQCVICPLVLFCLAHERQTISERPVRPPRKRTPHYDVVAGVIWQGEDRSATARFLIARRPLEGLLGGLWEFPGGKKEEGETLTEALCREINEEMALDIEVSERITVVKHAYTHFRITLYAFHARSNDSRPQHIGVADHAWVLLADLDKYAFAAADHKIIAALKAELTIDTAPAAD